MVQLQTQGRILHLLGGRRRMMMSVLVLLVLPLSGATPLRPAHRRESDSYTSDQNLQRLAVKRSTDGQDIDDELKVIPIQTMDDLIESLGVKIRARRAPKRGCQLGTCQLHVLADTLFQISKTNGKEQSKNPQDPRGYGR